MTALPACFLTRPIAHRGLHDASCGRPENSLAAFRAAIAAGYGIELDVQMSLDGAAMVFHDYHLGRLTDQTGPIAQRRAADLAGITLSGGQDSIADLTQVLDLIAGQVPLLIEIKDQDGNMGPAVGPLEAAVAEALSPYRGEVAVMSFNPNSVVAFGNIRADIPLGLVTDRFEPDDWPSLSAERRKYLAQILDFGTSGVGFISHNHTQLTDPPVSALKAQGVPVLCWTVRSPDEERRARRIADNITFEGYLP
ncbi:glycerophosphodiester phosphodiesterase family protein [Planktomarina temperata]|nr:glycerophosphodiester phosphodiesterase family protein [Planktomarina temperata]